MVFFVTILAAAYWFVFLSRRTPDELLDKDRWKKLGGGLWGEDRRTLSKRLEES
jgi:hypothetical protein